MFYNNIGKLVQYGINTGLIPECERVYTTNLLIALFGEEEYVAPCGGVEEVQINELETILAELLDEAIGRKIIEDDITSRDLFDTKLMNCFIPRPGQVQDAFAKAYKKDPVEATNYFYKLSQDSDYIRRYRVAKDKKWKVSSEFGDIDITINLSKPEKDPKAIAAALKAKNSSYPKCLLCMENEGYAGRGNHPARQNHRVIPITMNQTPWGFQYSPYVYYNEHCIIFNADHTPMKIEEATFRKLLDFVKLFPHYFLGSNADLPIVGGSILSHDHFQGGNYTFAMASAPIEKMFEITGYEDVEVGIVKWPLSVIRLRSEDDEKLVKLSTHILEKWREYSDEAVEIQAFTNEVPHNTITPIVRKANGKFEVDLALRNNRVTEEHPDGLFHPHQELHHIKKENIGLIEVMGLAVLPARLKNEMELLGQALVKNADISRDEVLSKHAAWAEQIRNTYGEISADQIDEIIETEVGKVFVKVLENAGVFKCDTEGRMAFARFMNVL